MVGCGHSLECQGDGGRFRREWITRVELSRAGMTVPHLYPQEVWRYHRRYDGTTYEGTTIVPGGG